MDHQVCMDRREWATKNGPPDVDRQEWTTGNGPPSGPPPRTNGIGLVTLKLRTNRLTLKEQHLTHAFTQDYSHSFPHKSHGLTGYQTQDQLTSGLYMRTVISKQDLQFIQPSDNSNLVNSSGRGTFCHRKITGAHSREKVSMCPRLAININAEIAIWTFEHLANHTSITSIIQQYAQIHNYD